MCLGYLDYLCNRIRLHVLPQATCRDKDSSTMCISYCTVGSLRSVCGSFLYHHLQIQCCGCCGFVCSLCNHACDCYVNVTFCIFICQSAQIHFLLFTVVSLEIMFRLLIQPVTCFSSPLRGACSHRLHELCFCPYRNFCCHRGKMLPQPNLPFHKYIFILQTYMYVATLKYKFSIFSLDLIYISLCV